VIKEYFFFVSRKKICYLFNRRTLSAIKKNIFLKPSIIVCRKKNEVCDKKVYCLKLSWKKVSDIFNRCFTHDYNQKYISKAFKNAEKVK